MGRSAYSGSRRASLITSTLSIFGSMRSRKMASGALLRSFSNAMVPFEATSTAKPTLRRLLRMATPSSGSSSTNRMRFVLLPLGRETSTPCWPPRTDCSTSLMFPPGITIDTDLGRTKDQCHQGHSRSRRFESRATAMPCAAGEFQAKNAAKAPESPTDHELSVAVKRTVLP